MDALDGTADRPGIDAAWEAVSAARSAQPALYYLGSTFTYGQLATLVDRTAAALAALGVGPGDRAIIFLPNIPQWVIAWLALHKIGAVPVPITPFYAASDLQYIASDSGAETVFCLDTSFGYIDRIRAQSPLKRVVVTTVAELLPPWKQWLGRVLNRVPTGRYRLDAATVTFGRLVRARAPGAVAAVPRGGSEIAEILYTGGTTGHPKGVPISHVLFLEAMREQRRARAALVPAGQDVILQGAPLYHILGQAIGLGGLLHGDRLILLPRVNLDATFEHIRRYQATTFFAVPTLYRMILEHDRLQQYDLRSLQYCFSGGDVLPVEIARRWQQTFGKPIYQGYGATETCGGIALAPAGAPFPEGTAGQIVPFQRVRVVNADTLAEVPPGEAGELLVSSEHMVAAYWNNPEETARCFVEAGGRRWYRTGDIVTVDRDGWLFFVDRSVDTIKHKGYRIAASRVETVLQEHPAVIAACVVGVPDANLGERIKAFVVLKQDVKGVTAYDLTTWCRQRLAPYEVPHYIEFRDMLPKSRVGKLLRRELRSEERRKQGA